MPGGRVAVGANVCACGPDYAVSVRRHQLLAIGVLLCSKKGDLDVMKRWISAGMTAACLGGCATYSEKIAPSYVSPVMYDSLNCRQIAEESSRVSQRAAVAAGAQDSQATRDNVATAAAIVIFWPAAFFVGGDRQNAAELARLKGEMDALEQAATRKSCGINYRRG